MSDRRRSISASPVETIWMTAAWPAARSASMDGDQGRGFHRGQQMAEEALLGGLEGRARGGLGLPVQRAAAPVMLAASIAAARLLWMMAKAPA
jgi:hypothetical protein